MFRRPLSAALLAVFCAFSAVFAQVSIVVNNVGYEKTGVKRAVVQSPSAISATTFDLINAQGAAVRSAVPLGPQVQPVSWSGDGFRYFKVADFSDFDTDGEYRVQVGSATSPAFAVGAKILQSKTGADQVGFFNKMRNTDEGDRALPVFGNSRTHNIYGGWWDATGDPGKHLSHLSYANYYSPQQIPLVVWALLHANEAQPGAFGAAAKSEAAWGADYLLRSLSSDGYFYMSVFDNWGDGTRWTDQPSDSKGDREICAWGTKDGMTFNDADGTNNSDGIRSANYQSAMREGGGMSIAALARAYAAGVSGDSSAARYLAGAERAYAHLKANPTRYQDDGKQNIIDYYCGLLAATELYYATDNAGYLTEAREWLGKLLDLQDQGGWFYSGKDNSGQNIRPFHHAADEGLPVVALSRYYQVAADNTEKLALREAVGRNLRHYANITYNSGSNPFEYAKMYRLRSDPLGGGGSIDVGGAYTIKIEAENYTSKEGDFRVENGAIGYIADGHSATYEFDADHADRYKLEFMVSTGNESSSFTVRVNGASAGTLSFGNTGGWSVFKIEALAGSGVQINKGQNTIRLEFQNAVNIDYLRIVSNNVVIEPPSDHQAFFFIPKVNETGYWWQGENARIASMASAFILGAPLADHEGHMWADTLFGMATAQLDWILGRNPFNLTMMYGYGRGSGPEYPNYPATRHLENIKGGICNGISSARSNENNIEWMPYKDQGLGDEFWRNWRFVEQWLPHNAWYLIAVSSLSYRIDNPIEPEDIVISVKHSAQPKTHRLKVSASHGRNIRIELPFAADKRTEAVIYNMQGRKIYTHTIEQGIRKTSLKIPGNIAGGVYVLSVRDMSGRNKVSERLHLR
ncbi:MAG: glycoside hydrolase family 9 protein [Chitinispirillia bacterium]|nr:glycoside hydrolase family 9 protein [Chitinispirillia bacterium]